MNQQHPHQKPGNRNAPRNAVLIGLALLFTACSTVARPSLEELEVQSNSGLLYSTSSDRSNPRNLHGASLSGKVYIFTERQSGINRVNYYLNDPNRAKKQGPFKTALSAPWDLMGTERNGRAVALDTSTLGDGEHKLRAVMRTVHGHFPFSITTFTVDNKDKATNTNTAVNKSNKKPSGLLVSVSSDRSKPVDLHGATLAGKVYIYTQPQNINRIQYHLNDFSRQKAPLHTTFTAPWDLMGTDKGTPIALDTRTLPDGEHNLRALMQTVHGNFPDARATFTVANTTGAKKTSQAPGNPLDAAAVRNAHYGTLTNPAIPANAVRIAPGSNIQAIVQKYPGNTTFVLEAGIHRLTTPIAPKEGNTFIGQSGAIVSGAWLLTSFSRDGNYWVASGQTQQGSRVGQCASNRPMCTHPEQLFIDNKRLEQVARLSDVRAGHFYFDYSAKKIYFQDNPNGKRVEASVAEAVFRHRIHNVTVRNLIVEKFATPAQRSALGATGDRWVIENNEVRYNHGVGMGTNNQARIRGNYVHRNGQLGMNGQGKNGLVEGNRIAHNNMAGYDSEWEAGGTKFVRTQNLMLRRNYVHHNNGYGLWGDVFNNNMTIEHNVTDDNLKSGIMYEISDRAIIRYNTSERNSNHGITISNSPNVEAHNNYLADNNSGIIVRQYKRGSTDVHNTYVHNNVVIQRGGQSWVQGMAAGLVVGPDQPGDSWYTSKNNRFQNNTYHLINGANLHWLNQTRTWGQWQFHGQDKNGAFTLQD